MPLQNLYGGAMCIDMPNGMADISNFREVPDNQEVFASTTTDQSVIVEILESVSQQKHEATKFHFEQLAESNASDRTHILSIQDIQVEGIPEAYMLVGQQAVAKFNEGKESENQVLIILALLRVPEHSADILVSLNAPLKISHLSSSSNSETADLPVDAQQAVNEFLQMVRTFRINDYTLFA
ncbi:hypothetical protein LPJ78_001801 [Coemansia sp. RSA 989]|nr:hypothetical protein BX667DRAFT_289492 [Coemansia mojavensis]KAJ1739687.1 hypothetical protein LPJ68_004460 [Coemansia sp. RSA 1086]KAJ1748157.1 hypothetical protein LPJ79_004750 [Coemansia sp. RSA 1821]KAJ1866440.1 hypothetical protein LPJ78_001801 [Coemansia sp. RSA 989]KAJ1874158.1 hypothetical protein LPJ55_001758 [Coemansia sp. RSA 990]KAJ2649203.1 hypothetical protein IWW40_003329 [Coemansia sp. RSA 1250]KAJ2670650.1 hypothetical protein IWW42_003828 [Coemansia sp. RSA 1085]